MKDLFCEDGHLSDYAFDCLVRDDPPDELARLEMAEHLSFCDHCVARYAALLCDESLEVSSPEPVTPGVMARLRSRARRLFVNRYSTAVVAASFAIVFWNIGVFSFDVDGSNPFFSRMTQSISEISESAGKVTDNLSQTLRDLFDNLSFERGIIDHEKK